MNKELDTIANIDDEYKIHEEDYFDEDDDLRNDDSHASYGEFIDWLSSKLQIHIGEMIGQGYEGNVHVIDKYRVIKIFQVARPHLSHNSLIELSNKNIDGVVKVYSVGEIEVPERFKGVPLLDDNKDSLVPIMGISYAIMQRINPDKNLQAVIRYLNNDFEEYCGGMGVFLLEYLFHGREYNELSEEELEKMNNDFDDFKNTVVTTKELRWVIDELSRISASLLKHGYIWSDASPNQFGLDPNGNIVAYDISTSKKGPTRYTGPEYKAKAHTIIRESIERNLMNMFVEGYNTLFENEQYRRNLAFGTWSRYKGMKKLSDDLAKDFAYFILKNGNELTLKKLMELDEYTLSDAISRGREMVNKYNTNLEREKAYEWLEEDRAREQQEIDAELARLRENGIIDENNRIITED